MLKLLRAVWLERRKLVAVLKFKKKKFGRKKRFSEVVTVNDNAIKIISFPANQAMKVLLQRWNNLFQQ